MKTTLFYLTILTTALASEGCFHFTTRAACSTCGAAAGAAGGAACGSFFGYYAFGIGSCGDAGMTLIGATLYGVICGSAGAAGGCFAGARINEQGWRRLAPRKVTIQKLSGNEQIVNISFNSPAMIYFEEVKAYDVPEAIDKCLRSYQLGTKEKISGFVSQKKGRELQKQEILEHGDVLTAIIVKIESKTNSDNFDSDDE